MLRPISTSFAICSSHAISELWNANTCESNTQWNSVGTNFHCFLSQWNLLSSNGGKISNFWRERDFLLMNLSLIWRRSTEKDFCCYYCSNEEYRGKQRGTRRGSAFALFSRRGSSSSRENMPILCRRCSWGTTIVKYFRISPATFENFLFLYFESLMS